MIKHDPKGDDEGFMTPNDMVEAGLTLDVEMPDVVDEDWLAGVSCNTDAPEECESCQ